MCSSPTTRRSLIVSGLAAAACPVTWVRAADDYPSRPLRIIVPYAPGGPGDVHARAIAEYLHKRFQQTVVVDNRPGALTAIGHRQLSQADPDGYTFGMLTLAAVVLPATMKGYHVDPVAGFTPIGQYNYGDYALAASSRVPAQNFAELAAYAKAHPAKFNVGSGGGHLDLVMALLGDVSGSNWSVIRYKGVAPARMALAAGEIDANLDTVGFAKDQAAAKKLKFIATTGAQRSPYAPDTPTIAESGLPNFEAGFWWGFGGPPGMPGKAVRVLNTALREAIQTPEVAKLLHNDGLQARTGTPDEFARYIDTEFQRWSGVARKYNIVQGD